MSTYGFMAIPAWECDISVEEGVYVQFHEQTTLIFSEKEDACEYGSKKLKLKIFDETVEIDIAGQKHKVPAMEEYDYFYIASVDIDLLTEHSNKAPQLAEFEEIPKLWYTTEKIPPICIIHLEKIPI